jgi:tetratricopeptide (TPR) repeat protein/transglutaminase-like putative cysteine protease
MTPLALVLAALVAGAAPQAAWDGPPLSGDPAAIAREAALLPKPEKSEIDLLLEEGVYVFDGDGRCTTTHRIVYRALTKGAAEGWAETSASFAPWHQAHPEVRARVITPDGRAHLLDPTTLVEAAADEGHDDAMYTDVRVVRGPLPAVGAGVVVEEVATVRDLEPFFDAGTVHRFFVARPSPARRVRLRVEGPASLPLRHLARNLEAHPRETVAAGRRVLEWEWSPSPVPQPREPWTPPDASAPPHVAFATGASWKAVATRYGQIVDAQLAGADLAAAAREAAGTARTREEAAQGILDWVAARVRYTGLELGNAAIVPTRPAETLKRHYGDCKDLSLLVAGMLRALGHPATLALLRTEWDEVAPGLPGLGEFDHAIVFVPGARPLWIDPTDPATPAGELPPWDRGRLALVAAKDQAAPVRTPEAAPGEDRIAVKRDVALEDDEWARATEVRELRGSFAAEVRRARRAASPDEWKKSGERLALERLAAKKLVSASFENVDRADAPVAIRFEATESRWGISRGNEAEAAVSPSLLFSWLPSELLGKREDHPRAEEGPDADAKEEEPGPRKSEMVLPRTGAGEIRYRIVPPPGFQPKPLPAGRKEKLGPASFESSFASDGNAITVTYRFDVPRRRLSAAEVAALRTGLVPLSGEEKVTFERKSTALLEAGRGREALDELRQVAAASPKAAAPHVRLALALVKLGMGEAARKEAARAVALEPDSAWARRVVAHVSAHDLVGRWMKPGCDLPAAVAAQRRAAELEPTVATTRAQLAWLLLHGERCERGAPGARRDEALELYRSAREDLKSKESDDDYLQALLEARRFKDAVKLARDMEKGPERSAGLVAALAATEGAPAGAAEAARLPPADRGTALQGATGHLVAARQYAVAARLLEAASAGAPNAAQLRSVAAVLASIKPVDGAKLDRGDPAAVPLRLMQAFVSGADDARFERDLVAKGIPAAGASDFGAALVRQVRRAWGQQIAPEVVLDVFAAVFDTRVEGEGAIRRVGLAIPNVPRASLYVVLEGGGWRVLAGDGDPGTLGARARDLVAAGDLAGARRVLGWARDEAGERSSGDAPADVLAALWPAGESPPAKDVDLAAAGAAAFGPAAARSIPTLEAARAGTEGARKRALAWALAGAYVNAERWESALAIAKEIAADDPTSERAFSLRAQALLRLGRTDELRKAADDRLRADPRDAEAVHVLASIAMRAGNAKEVRAAEARLVEMGKATPNDWNNLAWAALFLDPPPAGALGEARKAVQLSQEREPAYLHTLATVLASDGEPSQALEVLQKAIGWSTSDEPAPHDWLVIGRVAETYGLADEAIAAYRRVTPPKETDGIGSHVLARARLAKLAPAR